MPGEPLDRIVDMSTRMGHRRGVRTGPRRRRVGQEAVVGVKAYPGRASGRVAFVYPDRRRETRTARVRIEIPNPDGLLKAGMYATSRSPRRSAAGRSRRPGSPPCSTSGTRQVVLVDHGDGRFEPRAVSLGERADGYVAVLDGVAAGESVVVSANFLSTPRATSRRRWAASRAAGVTSTDDRRRHPLVVAQPVPDRAGDGVHRRRRRFTPSRGPPSTPSPTSRTCR